MDWEFEGGAVAMADFRTSPTVGRDPEGNSNFRLGVRFGLTSELAMYLYTYCTGNDVITWLLWMDRSPDEARRSQGGSAVSWSMNWPFGSCELEIGFGYLSTVQYMTRTDRWSRVMMLYLNWIETVRSKQEPKWSDHCNSFDRGSDSSVRPQSLKLIILQSLIVGSNFIKFNFLTIIIIIIPSSLGPIQTNPQISRWALQDSITSVLPCPMGLNTNSHKPRTRWSWSST